MAAHQPITADGRWPGARYIASPNCDDRPDIPVSLLVIHNISLPPGAFGGPGVEELFTNRLDPSGHPFYREIATLRVSAHFFVRRDGGTIQFVSCDRRAWHAGVSTWRGRERCNDFSIGVELEGTDHQPYEPAQYQTLAALTAVLAARYPIEDVAGHSHIAPVRKTDPGPHFDWGLYRTWVGEAARHLRFPHG